MADKVETKTVSVRHRGQAGVHGIRFFHDHTGAQVVLRPGETRDKVKVTEAEYDRMVEQSKAGEGELEVDGHEPPHAGRARATEPEMSRADLEKLERENLEEAAKNARGTERPAATGPTGEDPGPSSGPRHHTAATSGRKTRTELNDMTKEDLLAHGETVGAEINMSMNKDEMIDGVVKAQRAKG